MPHFNGEGTVGIREKLAEQGSREEGDLLHCLPLPLVVFSLQTFSEFIRFAIFFFFFKKRKHTSRDSSARSHLKQTFLMVARCFAGW